jgi:hypothetical protein
MYVRRTTPKNATQDNLKENCEQIEALLTVLETSASSILKSLDKAIADANALKSFLESPER